VELDTEFQIGIQAKGARVEALEVVRSVSVVGALAVFLAAGRASATSIEPIDPIVPADGDVDVPTNTLLWGDHLGSDRDSESSVLKLVGPAGVVPLTVSVLNVRAHFNGGVLVYTPQVELRPFTAYTIEAGVQSGRVGEEVDVVFNRYTFSTGAGPALSAPPLPTVSFGVTASSSEESEAALGSGRQARILAVDSGTPSEVAVLEDLMLEPEEMHTLGARPESTLEVLTDDVESGLSRNPSYWVPSRLSGLQPVRYGVFDAAGNFSGWVETQAEPLESSEQAREGGACSFRRASAAGPPASLLLAALGLAHVARRRTGVRRA
jgi:hypothetical protein